MNNERIRAVRDKIASIPAEKFTMREYCTHQERLAWDLEHDCDTAGCIAGWTCAMFAPDQLPSGWLAKRLLQLTQAEAVKLFTPDHKALSKITRDEAVATLTIFEQSGVVEWA